MGLNWEDWVNITQSSGTLQISKHVCLQEFIFQHLPRGWHPLEGPGYDELRYNKPCTYCLVNGECNVKVTGETQRKTLFSMVVSGSLKRW